jgi:hypothetical protein
MKTIVLLAAMAAAGCVQVEITNDHSKGGRAHQDIARTSSSTQSAEGAIEVPVSLVPK